MCTKNIIDDLFTYPHMCCYCMQRCQSRCLHKRVVLCLIHDRFLCVFVFPRYKKHCTHSSASILANYFLKCNAFTFVSNFLFHLHTVNCSPQCRTILTYIQIQVNHLYAVDYMKSLLFLILIS